MCARGSSLRRLNWPCHLLTSLDSVLRSIQIERHLPLLLVFYFMKEAKLCLIKVSGCGSPSYCSMCTCAEVRSGRYLFRFGPNNTFLLIDLMSRALIVVIGLFLIFEIVPGVNGG